PPPHRAGLRALERGERRAGGELFEAGGLAAVCVRRGGGGADRGPGRVFACAPFGLLHRGGGGGALDPDAVLADAAHRPDPLVGRPREAGCAGARAERERRGIVGTGFRGLLDRKSRRDLAESIVDELSHSGCLAPESAPAPVTAKP